MQGIANEQQPIEFFIDTLDFSPTIEEVLNEEFERQLDGHIELDNDDEEN